MRRIIICMALMVGLMLTVLISGCWVRSQVFSHQYLENVFVDDFLTLCEKQEGIDIWA
jgi:preprotein translocase subunit Sec63